jgi:tetratricopeptide (TPR) repeat protein
MNDIAWAEQQVAKARRESNRRALASNLSSLGNMYAVAYDTQKAIPTLSEAIQILMDLNEPDLASTACKNMASVYDMLLHDYATAAKYMEMAANLASSGNPSKKTYASMAASLHERARGR